MVLVAAFFVIIANLIVDVLYGVIDPRVRRLTELEPDADTACERHP